MYAEQGAHHRDSQGDVCSEAMVSMAKYPRYQSNSEHRDGGAEKRGAEEAHSVTGEVAEMAEREGVGIWVAGEQG